jgi:hypothetical protein
MPKKKKYHPIDAVRYSPYRPTRWRYDRVMELVESPDRRTRNPIPNVDDEWTRQAFVFMKKWDKYSELDTDEEVESKRRGLVNNNLPLYQAYEFFLKPDGDKLKGEVEARILTGQDDLTIADKVSCFPESVEWYEKMFYNVRDRLKNTSYVVNNVIGPLVSAGFENATVELTAKFFGFIYQNVQLMEQILLGINTTITPPANGQDTLSFFDSSIENTIQTLVMRTAHSMAPNKFDAKEMLIVWKDLMSLRREASGSDMSRTNIEENVSAFLSSITWSVGRQRQELLDSTPLAGYVGHTAEPRAMEQLALIAGETPSGIDNLRNLQLPPPRKKSNDKEESK